ncbi:MAG: formate dehydrogenase subunit alpha [Chloroflexi bacterium]|nr:formate dehydrogenase subunit alpha [Chloroflexota bacterium]MYC00578.1 formate dehydrogenase subunit alpha [Chloroflexota bacterium]
MTMETSAAMINLSIDGQTRQATAGTTILDAVLAAGIDLPHLCKDLDGPALGACRTCLVEIEGQRGLPAACHTPVSEGQAILTDSDTARAARKGILELTLAMTDNTAHSNGGATTELRHHATTHEAAVDRWVARSNEHQDETNHFYRFDATECILCGRCVSACSDRQHIGAIGIAGAGKSARIASFGDEPLGESTCTSCGSCVAACPTEALMPKRAASGAKTVSTVCPYCGVGCGIKITAEDGILTHVDDDPDNLSSKGLLCVKGRFGTAFVNHSDRLTTPLIRGPEGLQPASWDEALDLVAEKFAEHRGAFGAFSSAKATNEDNYILQKFVRAVMGTNNIDHCTRLCHSPSVEAMLAQLGSGATSNSYSDYEAADCLFVVGADPSSNHPVAASRMRTAVDRGASLIVLNPKRIELCDHTDLWLQQYPGTDVAVLNGMARVILDEGLADRPFIAERTEGFDEWLADLDGYTPERVEELSGVPAELLIRAARMYARPNPVESDPGGSCLIWGMGVTQHTNGTANATALLNLALLTGQVGRIGNGVSPLRGQNNVQGAGDAGCVPDALPGYQRYTSDVLDKFNNLWEADLPATEGLRATDMVESMLSDDGVRCMYIVGENPLLTEPNLAHAHEAFAKLDFLVVQDIFMHETAELADVVLPAASFAEKEGTFTNSERRVQRVRQVIPPVGQSRADWEIVQDVARRTARRLGVSPGGFEHGSASSVFDELASLTPIMAGLSHRRLDQEGGIQWPCPSADHPGTPRLYDESFPRGLGKFIPVRQLPPSEEVPDERYPLILNTGRVLYHWHGGTMTRRVEGLVDSFPELRIAIHPNDAARMEIVNDEAVWVASRRGRLEGVSFITEDVAEGSVFVPFVRLAESAANWLTNNVYDEVARIPEYKVCAVAVERAGEPSEWRHSGPDGNGRKRGRRGKRRQYW